MAANQFTQKNFEAEVVKSGLPVLVDFWAPWCGPCRAIAPIIDEVAVEFSAKLKVGKVNVDDEQDLAAQFNIMSIPTLLIFKNGKPVDQIVGAMSKEQLLQKIKTAI